MDQYVEITKKHEGTAAKVMIDQLLACTNVWYSIDRNAFNE